MSGEPRASQSHAATRSEGRGTHVTGRPPYSEGMRRRSTLVLGSVLAVFALLGTACASDPSDLPGGPAPSSTADPDAANGPTTEAAEATDAAAEAQAQAWLDAAAVPPGAVPTDDSIAFGSYQGWPCTPVATRERVWTLADATVASATNWLREHPTADLVSTAVGPPLDEGSPVDGAIVGYIPVDESQQGVVFTVQNVGDGVAIRAQVAALTQTATCPPGQTLGKPGQG